MLSEPAFPFLAPPRSCVFYMDTFIQQIQLSPIQRAGIVRPQGSRDLDMNHRVANISLWEAQTRKPVFSLTEQYTNRYGHALETQRDWDTHSLQKPFFSLSSSSPSIFSVPPHPSQSLIVAHYTRMNSGVKLPAKDSQFLLLFTLQSWEVI